MDQLSPLLLKKLSDLSYNHYTIRITPYGHYTPIDIAKVFKHNSMIYACLVCVEHAKGYKGKMHIHIRITTTLKKSTIYKLLCDEFPKLKGNGMKALRKVIYNGEMVDETSYKSATYVMKDQKNDEYWAKNYTTEECEELIKLGNALKPQEKKKNDKTPIYLKILENYPELRDETAYTDIRLTMRKIIKYYYDNWQRFPSNHVIKRILHNMYMLLDHDYRQKFYKKTHSDFYYELCCPKFKKGLKQLAISTYGDSLSDTETDSDQEAYENLLAQCKEI